MNVINLIAIPMPASGAGVTHRKRFLSITKSSPADTLVIHWKIVSKKSRLALPGENGGKSNSKFNIRMGSFQHTLFCRINNITQICSFKKKTVLERWISSKECLLFLQRTWVWLPALTWWITVTCDSSSRGFRASEFYVNVT